MVDKKISQLTGYTPPIDADFIPIVDNTTSATKKLTWANIKAALKTYFDSLYAAVATAVTLAGTQELTNKTLTSPTINPVKKLVQVVTALTPAGAGTSTCDLSLGNVFVLTMPANTQTLAISNATIGQIFTIDVNNVTSQGALTWFTTIRWADGTAPTLTGTNGKRDSFGFKVTGANTYDGFIIGQNI